MEFFIYCTYNDMFFTGSGFTSDFMECMFFTGVAYALGSVEDFLNTIDTDELPICIEDFVLYQKGDIC